MTTNNVNIIRENLLDNADSETVEFCLIFKYQPPTDVDEIIKSIEYWNDIWTKSSSITYTWINPSILYVQLFECSYTGSRQYVADLIEGDNPLTVKQKGQRPGLARLLEHGSLERKDGTKYTEGVQNPPKYIVSKEQAIDYYMKSSSNSLIEEALKDFTEEEIERYVLDNYSYVFES